MTDFNLITYMHDELRRTPTAFRRYMYDSIIWDDRMVGLVGPRDGMSIRAVFERLSSSIKCASIMK